MTARRRRLRIHIEGIVQGVGFRPFVFRLAHSLDLDGFVLNDPRGVVVEVEGAPGEIQLFLERLPAEPPPLASIERMSVAEVPSTACAGFDILNSERGQPPSALVAPDTATCIACLAELFDPSDRRYRYPFINCTDCGPRFTIVRGIPYDRPLTTMAGFRMCDRCRTEYDDPLDRRFHAQPNACPACGPQVRLVDAEDRPVAAEGDPVAAAEEALLQGSIVAVKGVGGFHLACRADHEAAVARLRGRKHREDRPFALMVPELAAARALIEMDQAEEALLGSPERPIVLARRRPGASVAPSVAPGQRELGVMLPYSPLHHLLLADCGTALVMTSGNISDEPIAFRDEDALERLAAIADLFLLHDRPIQTRTDDSVVRVVSVAGERRPLMLRRSRGYVPRPVTLPLVAALPMLACGAELKNTFCLGAGARAWVGPHVGDLRNYESLRSFREGIEQMERLFALAPEVVAHDLHPEYLSTKYALDRTDLRPLGVQHHHAHLAACLAEHGEESLAVGAIYDGAGYGSDGTAWGGEILFGGLRGFERVAHLWPVRMPGGDAAVREPWRMACSWLCEGPDGEPDLPSSLAGRVEPARWRAVARLARGGFSSPATTSMGRLFDAVAALCGVRPRVTFEGQAAMELEAAADPAETGAYPLPLLDTAGPTLLDARELVRAVCADVRRGAPVATISARFHNGVAEATGRICAREAERRGVSTVVLSGGVFQNVLLLERTSTLLTRAGLHVLVPRLLPSNDGGISYGQTAVASAVLSAE